MLNIVIFALITVDYVIDVVLFKKRRWILNLILFACFKPMKFNAIVLKISITIFFPQKIKNEENEILREWHWLKIVSFNRFLFHNGNQF